jgi:hypothetical protein
MESSKKKISEIKGGNNMKRTIILILLLLLVLSSYVLANNILPPFEKAKQMALQCDPDPDGRYLLFIEDRNTGYVFMIAYLSKTGHIGIGVVMGNDVAAVEFCENTGIFTYYYEGVRQVIDQERAIKAAFLIFRQLVKDRLI